MGARRSGSIQRAGLGPAKPVAARGAPRVARRTTDGEVADGSLAAEAQSGQQAPRPVRWVARRLCASRADALGRGAFRL